VRKSSDWLSGQRPDEGDVPKDSGPTPLRVEEEFDAGPNHQNFVTIEGLAGINRSSQPANEISK
jgi:hypothetical protein